MTGIIATPQTATWRGKTIKATLPSEVKNLNGLIRVFKAHGSNLVIENLETQQVYSVEEVKTLYAVIIDATDTREPIFSQFVFGAASEWTFSVEGEVLYGTRTIVSKIDESVSQSNYRFQV